MKRIRTSETVLALVLALVGLPAARAHGDHGRGDSEELTECCFNNSRYAGICVVNPGEDETCASILEYLDNPSSSGKSYCGFTDIRGGWKEISCEEALAPSRASASTQIPDRVGDGPDRDTPSGQTQEEAYPECRN
jgi:hypothetical protein